MMPATNGAERCAHFNRGLTCNRHAYADTTPSVANTHVDAPIDECVAGISALSKKFPSIAAAMVVANAMPEPSNRAAKRHAGPKQL